MTKSQKKYNILIISDTEILAEYPVEQLKLKFKNIDFIISSGDLSNRYLDYLFTTLNKDIIYVNGNHTYSINHDISFCKDVDGHVIKYKGLKIFGLGGSKKYSYQSNQYSEKEVLQRILLNTKDLLLGNLDIMISHTPPRHIHDKEEFVHQGFRVFHKILKYCKPKLWIHGHIHLKSHNDIQETMVGETKVINAYGYKIIEYIKEIKK